MILGTAHIHTGTAYIYLGTSKMMHWGGICVATARQCQNKVYLLWACDPSPMSALCDSRLINAQLVFAACVYSNTKMRGRQYMHGPV